MAGGRLSGGLIAAILWSQQTQQIPTFTAEVEVVNILCSVRDKNGALVPNLTRDDFIVVEEGERQQIRYFTRETDVPLTLGLLVDVSPSQERLLEIERRAAAQFFESVLRPKDLAFLISFGAEVELLQDLTSSVELLRAGLDRLRLSGAVGGLHPGPVPTIHQPRSTALFDAVYLAAREKLEREVGRKAIVLITDGVDVGSRVKLEEAIEAAQKADAIIYAIYYVDPEAYSRRGFFRFPSDGDLKRMAEETGGRVFRVSKKRTLQHIFDELQEEMRSQYAIGYTPTNPAKDGSFRRIEVRTVKKGLKVQARKGYYALRREP
ncbi:MAG: VWA domain-containing protein [Bryobacterales bacterium]|nr:VWA domain-containing protein [Bryobacteraceae bacterium]MDW8353206.1 VWA domain-containing protein [Bryobacterales bacterium]